MKNISDNYLFLIGKLDEFIRKYYKNQLIRGAIYSFAAFLLSFILIDLTEYYFYLGIAARTSLFYLFLLLNFSLIARLVILPAVHYYQLGKIIDHRTAAEIIGNHFPQVKDKLLNTLQLRELAGHSPDQTALISASIDQKIELLKPVPFTSAINLRENRKYLKYALVPLGFILIIVFTAPSIITEGTHRLIRHQTHFEKTAPFQFLIQNAQLQVMQNEDFELDVKLTGDELPQEVYVEIDEHILKLEKSNKLRFTHLFKNLQKTKKFRLFANGFYSREYELKVSPSPTVLDFNVRMQYPAYLNRKTETLKNTGDLTVPAGTVLTWTFHTENTDEVRMLFEDMPANASSSDKRIYTYSKRAFRNTMYAIKPLNTEVRRKDSIVYHLEVIPDLYPSIEVQQREDSLSSKLFYFIGSIKDDHGFKQLSFNYRFTNGERDKKLHAQPINIQKNHTEDQFFYYWNLGDINIQAGDELEYYFEVFDNDGVNGSKSTRSEIRTFKAPTLEQIEKQSEAGNNSLKEQMNEAIRKAEVVQRESKKLGEKLINKKNLSFDEKNAIKELLEKQQELMKSVEDIQKQHEMNNREQSEYIQPDERLLEKKEQLEELFNNLLDEKTKELMRQLEKLLQENNKNLTQDQLEKLQLDNKSLEKELDRMLELFKQLEFDEKLSKTIEKLEQLSEEEKKLSEKSLDKQSDPAELKEQQDQLNKEFKDIGQDMQDLEQKNQEMEDPQDFESPEQEMQDIENEMNKSSDELQKGKSQKASQSQKSASDKMKKLSDKMKAMQADMAAEEMEVNMQALRDILENLIKVSFEQEKAMEDLKRTNVNDPKYLALAQKQKMLKDDLTMIEDSLFELSKKVPQIESYVNKEIASINQNVEKSIENLAERRIGEAAGRQQYVMTHVNNLAVMLSEALQQMQEQMMQMKGGGEGSCKKPKKGQKPGLQGLSKMQEELNKQLQQMKDGMKPGQKPGKGQLSEQMARMAAQQQAIRQALEQLSKEDGSGSPKSGNLDKLAKEMEKTETDLYNKMISQETLLRQKEIMTRLLEAEKAEREREYDNKRESKEGKEQDINYQIVFEEYKKLKLKELELIKTVPPSLNSFYKNKINTYFQELNKEEQK